MPKLLKVFLWGMVISAVGTLPLGTLNLAAMQIAIAESITAAIYFALGVAFIEILYVRLSIVGMDWVRKQKKLVRWMDWIAFLMVLALAIGSFYVASQPHKSQNILLQNNVPRFMLGVILSAINPVQIPFWFGWSTVLFSKNILLAQNNYYNTYIAGIGLGTLLGLAIFIWGGPFLINKFNAHQSLINYSIGGIFSITALLQLIKILQRKGLSHAIEKIGQKK